MIQCSRWPIGGRARSGRRAGAASTRSASRTRNRPAARRSSGRPRRGSRPIDQQRVITGTNRIGGTVQCTRDSLSSRSLSNIRGEARSRSVRLRPWSSSVRGLAIGGILSLAYGRPSGVGADAAPWVPRAGGRGSARGRSVALLGVPSAGIASTMWRSDSATNSQRSTRWRALEARDLDIGQRQESVLRGVEVVGQPAAVAVDRKAQQTGDSMPLGLDDDPLLTVLHGRGR